MTELDRLKTDVATLGPATVATREIELTQERDARLKKNYLERHERRQRK